MDLHRAVIINAMEVYRHSRVDGNEIRIPGWAWSDFAGAVGMLRQQMGLEPFTIEVKEANEEQS